MHLLDRPVWSSLTTHHAAMSEGDGLARRFATEHKVTLVLKGWRTLVAHPDGRVAVNTTGNPSMAKGGSGDILTGIVAAPPALPWGAGAATRFFGDSSDMGRTGNDLAP